MPKPLGKNSAFLKVKTETSEPVVVKEKDFFADHISWEGSKYPEGGGCPTSTHKKKLHKAKATHRQTVTTIYANGNKSRTYLDHCKCQFCGYEWKAEWMVAF